MKSTPNIGSDVVKQRERHVLFVEGGEDSIDATVLMGFLDIDVMPMGVASHVKSVAKALAPVHPTYYFLIDRDHSDDIVVERSWRGFPDPDASNLLIWRKKELENYFLEPDFLAQSQYLVKPELLRGEVLRCMERRLCLGVTNCVIVSVREELKENWINCYSNPEDFPGRSEALAKLLASSAFAEHVLKVKGHLGKDELARRFNQCFDEMTGGGDTLSYGAGRWLDLLPGKAVLSETLNSNCFVVKSRGKALQGRDKFDEIIKDLLSGAKTLPDDFVKLKELIQKKVLSRADA